ncbi:PLDc N-terminal domain-containing protein [Demequina sp. NBRC 110055]|uniref:PLDc N-terminal domain-containing protein n=1 Tax=Demequina sp. NBRC 110055 TaxID=1570344 RepID=UPI0009FD9B4D|nr:PLDc N-terminal domain-containing protein [Demequina sp. NBRC 110055]
MPLDANPLIPTAYDVVWSVIAAAILVATLSAAISVARHTRVLSGAALALWLLLVLCLPGIGAVVWFVAGRGPAQREMERLYPEAPPLR